MGIYSVLCEKSHHRCRIVSRGLYDHQLAYWQEMFPKDHFCVVSHDFFLADPGAALEVVARFYGLAEYDWRALVQRYKFHWSNHKSLVCVTSLG